MTANQPGIQVLKKGLFSFSSTPAHPEKRSATQTGLNRPVFLPSKSVIPDYKPNNHKSGKP
jgi:hypothetical protein